MINGSKRVASGSWLWIWAVLHVMSLPQLQNRLRVQTQWLWSYCTGQRSSPLIPEEPSERKLMNLHLQH